MSSKRRYRTTVLLLFSFCFLCSLCDGKRNGDVRDYGSATVTASEGHSIEEQMAAVRRVGERDDLTSAELDGPSPHDQDWKLKPNIICDPTGHNEKPLCRCLSRPPRKIDCRGAKLKNGRPLDTAFLSLKDEQKFGAKIIDLSGNEIQLLRKKYLVPNEREDVLVIDASHNWISDIEPYALDHFPKLATLRLSDNRLSDAELSNDWMTKRLGASLHQLYLDYNHFMRIDDGIFDNLVNLRKLVLDGNYELQLTAYTFGDALVELQTISLDYCGIETLDENIFKRLPNLQQLSLSGNPISSIVPALRHVPKLSILSMSETRLETVPKNVFKSNPELKNIYMRRMSMLKSVESCAFCGLDNLEVLDFTNSTHLAVIDDNAFGGLSDQEVVPLHVLELHLTNCNLNTVDSRLLQWHSLRKLGFAGNRWNCECPLYWLIGDRNLHKFVGQAPRCDTPKELQGQSLYDVRSSMSCSGAPMYTANDEGNSTTFIIIFLFAAVTVVIVGGVAFTRRHGGAGAVLQRVRESLPMRENNEMPFDYANLDRSGCSAMAADNGAVVVGSNIEDYDDAPDAPLEDDFHRPVFV